MVTPLNVIVENPTSNEKANGGTIKRNLTLGIYFFLLNNHVFSHLETFFADEWLQLVVKYKLCVLLQILWHFTSPSLYNASSEQKRFKKNKFSDNERFANYVSY